MKEVLKLRKRRTGQWVTVAGTVLVGAYMVFGNSVVFADETSNNVPTITENSTVTKTVTSGYSDVVLPHSIESSSNTNGEVTSSEKGIVTEEHKTNFSVSEQVNPETGTSSPSAEVTALVANNNSSVDKITSKEDANITLGNSIGEDRASVLTNSSDSRVEKTVEEENRKRLDYFEELNASGASRIEIPEGMTVIDSNAFKNNTKLKEVILPSTLKSIGTSAFEGTSLSKIELPSSLTYIGKNAFANIKTLTEVIIPKSVESASYAFYGDVNLKKVIFEDGIVTIPPRVLHNTGIEEIVLPSSVKTIGSYAFSNSKSLEKINLLDGVRQIEEGAFSGDSKLSVVELPETLTEISSYVFSDTPSLTHINLPSGITNIRDGAFTNSGLISITLPKELTGIGRSAFSGTHLSEIYFPKQLNYLGINAFSYIDTLKKVTVTSDINKSWDGWFWEGFFDASPLTTVVIEEGVTKIPAKMFYNRQGIMNINFPSTMKEIASYAFGKTSLKKVLLPSALENIGERAFGDIETLTSIDVGSNLVTGKNAFNGSKNLVTINLKSGARKIVDGFLANTGITEFVVPEGVEEIGEDAFSSNEQLTKLILPSTLKTIGERAFSNTSLKEIVFPASMKTIPEGILENTQVEKIVLSEGVEEIGDYAFANNKLLKSVVFPSTLKKIGRGAFMNSNLESVTLPSGLEEIAEKAFFNNKLSAVTLPTYLKTLGDYAFSNNNLKEVTLPSRLEVLGTAFVDNSELSKITFSEGLKEITSAFSGTSIKSVVLPKSLEKIGNGAFYNLKGLADISIPENVTSIGDEAFYNTGLTSIDLPANLKIIGRYAFSGTKLKKVVLPSQVETIGNHAFSIESLESVHIPKSLKSVTSSYNTSYIYNGSWKSVEWGEYYNAIFSGDKNLKTVTFEDGISEIISGLFKETGINKIDLPSSVTKIGSSAFANSDLTTINLPSSLSEIQDFAFANTKLKEITIPDSVEKIGYGAFDSVKTLDKVILPTNLKEISSKTFYKTNIAKITIPESVSSIGGIAFADTPLKSITLPNNLISIGQNAFSGTQLTTVVLPSKIKTLENEAFGEIANLVSVNIPLSLESGYNAFSNSKKLENVIIEDGREKIPAGLLSNIGIKTFTLPSTIKTIENNAFAQNDYLSEIVLNNALETIDDRAFANANLKHVKLPDSLTYLGRGAFENNHSLTEVIFPKQLRAISENAFANTGLTKLEVPSNIEEINSGAFYNTKLSDLILSEGIKRIASSAFVGNQLKVIELPASLQYLGSSAFGNSSKLRVVKIKSNIELDKYYDVNTISPFSYRDYYSDEISKQRPESIFVNFEGGVSKVSDYLFNGVTPVKSVTFKDNINLTEIGNHAFDGTSLTFLTLPDTVETLGEFAFGNINTLNSVNIPEKLTTADRAFAGSKKLNELRNKIEGIRIPDGMFENTGLTTFIVPSGIKEIGKYAFRNNKSTAISFEGPQEGFKDVILPVGLTKIDSRAFESTEIDYYDIPDTVSEIGDGAFRFNPNLKSIKLPSELQALKGYLFEGNKGMKLLVIPDKVESIDTNAFVNMEGLENVYIPASVTNIGENLIANKDKVTFHVVGGSYAETYLKANGFKTVALGDDYKHYNDSIVTRAHLLTTSQNLKFSGDLSLRLEYELKTAGRNISDTEIVITLPDDKVSFNSENPIVKKGTISGKNKNVLTLKDINSLKGTFDFNVKTTAEELTYLDIVAQIRYKENGIQRAELLGHINEEMPYLTINVNDYISSNSLTVSGKTKPNTKIKLAVIDSSERILETVSKEDGSYSAVVPVDVSKLSSDENSLRKILLTVISEISRDNIIAKSKTILYHSSAPRLKSFIMKHHGQSFDLTDGKPNNNVIFRPGEKFEFEVELENDKNVSRVSIKTSRNNKDGVIHLSRQSNPHLFKYEGFFDVNGIRDDFIPKDFVIKVETLNSRDSDGDGLIDSDKLKETDKVVISNDNPIIADKHNNSWDVSDRDLLIFSGLAYLSPKGLEGLFPKNGETGLSYFNFDSLNGDQKPSYQFYDLDIKSTDKSLFSNWIFVKQLQNAFKEPEIAGDDKFVGDYHSTVSYFIDKNKKNIIVAFRGSEEVGEAFPGNKLVPNARNPQERAAKYQIRKIIEEIKLNYPHFENIYITGHSLGGYQAVNAGDWILEDDKLSDIEGKLRRVLNFNGPGFNNQEAGLSRARAKGNMFTRYLVDEINLLNGGATIGQMPNDVKVPYKKTIHHIDNRLFGIDISVHNLTSFFYTLEQGYRSSKARFIGNYPLINDVVEVKDYLLTLPESLNYVIDPSGTVINSITSKTLSGVQVTVYYKDADGKEKVWNADDYSQLNPVLTSINGEYAWDVPEGLWKVKVSKEGYDSSESDWLPVAPVQTGIDFKLVPHTYALTYDLGGGSVTRALPSTYQTDVEIPLGSPARSGYIFEGWYDNPDFIGNKIDSTLFNSVGDKTLWAKWALARQVKTRQESRVITTDKVEYVDDASLEAGKIREVAAINGKVLVEITDVYVNGELQSSTERELSRIEPQAKKVYRGTKQVSQVPDVAPIEQNKPEAIIETKVRQESRALKIDKVEYVDDSSLDVGKVREVAAINGKVLVEITDIYVNSELQLSTERELSRIEPQAKKVYRGTKQVSHVPDVAPMENNKPEVIIETKVRQESRVLKTDKIEYVDDSSLDAGKVREVVAINGKVLVEITDVYVNDELQLSTEKELSRIEPQAKKVYRGTKQVSYVPDIAPIEIIRIERNNITKEHQGVSTVINTKIEQVVMNQSSSEPFSSKETTIRTKGYLPNTSSEYGYGFELAGIIALATAHFGIISNKRKKNIKN
ncbi:leucine-rich repeat protein [Streptococcus sp. IMAU 99125]|uniref:Leucine-rich repeat protein n=1 Tax=Streptococcus humanilactis TaxID=2841061 RepID=A0ABS7DVQ7_9STRE|nr:leucine-rich repeat protein [Streptococcus humanilactis]MBW7580233.1 leucine-rich repeat protein [Streptococcus humanilactis]MBW7582094.1 leucine-rich repeat protein [Streptococcus humanilactis]